MSFENDPLFGGGPQEAPDVGYESSPCFRLAIQSNYELAHPFKFTNEYEELFAVFAPILQERCKKLWYSEEPGGKWRRRKSIKDEDWHPFEHLKKVIPADDAFWLRFAYLDTPRYHPFDSLDNAVTRFKYFQFSNLQLDVCIPLDDWRVGKLDMNHLMAALSKLPFGTMMAGFGLSISDSVEGGGEEFMQGLMPIAEKYPALDIAHSERRSWFADYEDDLSQYWLSGINWITGVGGPFLAALGGADRLMANLPAGITAFKGQNSVMFQLGDRPITGQAGVDDDLLPLYHALGQRLKPAIDGCPTKKHPHKPVFSEYEMEKSLAWSRRFYD